MTPYACPRCGGDEMGLPNLVCETQKKMPARGVSPTGERRPGRR